MIARRSSGALRSTSRLGALARVGAGRDCRRRSRWRGRQRRPPRRLRGAERDALRAHRAHPQRRDHVRHARDRPAELAQWRLEDHGREDALLETAPQLRDRFDARAVASRDQLQEQVPVDPVDAVVAIRERTRSALATPVSGAEIAARCARSAFVRARVAMAPTMSRS